MGSLTDTEVSAFSATVDYMRSIISAAFGLEWSGTIRCFPATDMS